MHGFVRNGDTLADLFLPEPAEANGIGIVWCPGLPNTPLTEDMAVPLSRMGFTVIQVKYPGSWHSYGNFGPASSIQGAINGLELLAAGRARNLNTEQEIQWSAKRLVLAGSSYGGGVAACALALSPLADAAVLFCPLLDPVNQNQDAEQPEDDLTTLLPYLQRCHENVFRGIDEREWQTFLSGESPLNPVAYLNKLRNRRILFVHGEEDRTIRSYHTEEYYRRLHSTGQSPSELLLVEGIGHGKALRARTWEAWIKWVRRSELQIK